MLWRAKNYGDAKLYQQAVDTKTPSCDKIQQIYSWSWLHQTVCVLWSCERVNLSSHFHLKVLQIVPVPGHDDMVQI